MKAAIYLRVSTNKQTVDAQRQELLEICRRRRSTEVAEFSDVISGAKVTRIGLDQMMSEVRRAADWIFCSAISWIAWGAA